MAKVGRLKLEHSTLQGLPEALALVVSWPEVSSCFPGRIRRTKPQGRPQHRSFLTVQAPTSTGLKLVAHGSGAVQEVFVVTNEPDKVRDLIAEHFDLHPKERS